MISPGRLGGPRRTVQQVLGLVLRQEGRQPPGQPRAPDLAGRVLLDHASAREEPEATPGAREAAGDGGLRQPALVKPRQIGADEPRVRRRQRRALAMEKLREFAEVGGVVAQGVWRRAALDRQIAEEGGDGIVHQTARRGASPPLPKPPPRTQCEPQDAAGAGPRRPRRAIQNWRRQSRRSNVDHVAFLPKAPSRLLKKAHLLRWRPRPHAQRTESTPRVRPSGAALHLDLFEQPASFSASLLESGWEPTGERLARCGRGSSAGFAGATDSWGEASEGGRSPPSERPRDRPGPRGR